jgi:hypothetical protein
MPIGFVRFIAICEILAALGLIVPQAGALPGHERGLPESPR